MLRMEIALIIILGFIAYMYYSAERKHTKLHRTFSILLLVVIVHLVFDAVTIYTVNHLEQVPLVVNDAVHRVFVGTMAGVLYLFYRYIAAVVEEETKKKMIFDWPAKIFLIVLEIIATCFSDCIHTDTKWKLFGRCLCDCQLWRSRDLSGTVRRNFNLELETDSCEEKVCDWSSTFG